MNKRLQFSVFILFLSLLGISMSLKSQIAVTGAVGQSPLSLVESTLVGDGVIVENGLFNWSSGNIISNQIGTFTNGAAFSAFPFENGIIMTTGGITVAVGTNNSGSASVTATGTSSVRDAELQSLISQELRSTTVLEFDFKPSASSFQFEYIFASEEYPEFVCSSFNDVFGFFLSGLDPLTGIPTTKNIALIPGTSLPVAINSVNPGVPGTSSGGGTCISLAYSSFYVSNAGGTHMQFDGYTTALPAGADVIACTPYHMKLSIANAGDNSYDSGVFLKAQSFVSQQISIEPQFTISAVDTLIEGCNNLTLRFNVDPPATDIIPIYIDVNGGTAVNGVDYETIGDMLYIMPGDSFTELVINPIADDVLDGTKHLRLIASLYICDLMKSDTIEVDLIDYQKIVLRSFDSTVCNIYENLTLPLVKGYLPLNVTWTPSNITNITETTSYTVIASDRWGCSSDTAEINVIVKPLIELDVTYESTIPGLDTLINDCNSLTVTLTLSSPATEDMVVSIDKMGSAQSGVDYVDIPDEVWFAPGEVSKQFQIIPTPSAFNIGTKTIELYTNFDFCGASYDTIIAYLLYNPPVSLLSVDTTVCGTCDIVTVPLQTGATPLQVSWNPTTYLGHADRLMTTANISRSTLYTVIATDRWGCSSDTATVNVQVNPAPQPSFTYSPHRGCDPLTVRFTSTTTPANAVLYWDLGNGDTSTEPNPISEYSVGTYPVSLTASTASDCEATFTLPNAVDVAGYPSADFSYLPSEPLNGRPVSFTNMSTGSDITQYLWSFGDGGSSRVQNPTYTYRVDGDQEFEVSLTVVNSHGCSSFKTYPLFVIDNFAFWIPNAFSPDQNGNNDIFKAEVFDIFDYTFSIFDRFGSCIFKTTDPNMGWNGAYNGVLCPTGIYIWRITYVKYSDPNIEHEKTGEVYLMR